MSRPTLRRWILSGPLIILLLLGALLAWIEPDLAPTVGFLGIVTGLLTASVLFNRRSTPLEPRERTPWRAIGVSVGLVGTGVLLVGILTTAGLTLPAFGIMDVFFLGGYATAVFAMVRMARSDADGPDWILTVLDGLVGAIALSALIWTAFYSNLIDALSEARWWETVIAATYPIVDVAMVIALMILVIRRSNYHLDIRLGFLAAGMSFQILADFIFLSSGVGEVFTSADPAWVLNLLATTMLLTTATLVDRVPKKREYPEMAAPLWAMVWPYLFAGGLLGVHVASYRSLQAGVEQIVLLDAVLTVGAVIFFRQVVLIHRNRNRVEQQRSELVGSVSHELRTPLTAIVGYLTLLDENPDDFPEDAKREMVGEANKSARHMSRLVSDLLMLAKGSNRQLILELSDVDLSSLVNSTLRNAETDRTRVQDHIEGDTTLRVDADRIQQALGNLLSNAARYGGTTVHLVAKVEDRNLLIEVHDDGPGVPTRYEAMIWQRFERGAHRLDATTPGLGIGLAIVRAVADSHGGVATYRRSERLGGACFAISVPNCAIPRAVIAKPVEASR